MRLSFSLSSFLSAGDRTPYTGENPRVLVVYEIYGGVGRGGEGGGRVG